MKAHTFLGKKISGPFTIPSGVIATSVNILERIAREIPEIGVLTTKSIGPYPREGHREPVYTQYAPGCFMNAVGLTNPGAEEFSKQLELVSLPTDRFLLISIFGAVIEEYVKTAQILAPYADGLELNLSCPNARGLGVAFGQDPDMVREITRAVSVAVNLPVIPKLTPNVANISEIARAAVEGGAAAICGINSLGPGCYTVDGHPVLTNTYGGMCGKGILPIGLKCLREIAQAVDVPLIGCGGISSAADVREYQQAGASIFGVGTALTGLSTPKLQYFFAALQQDLDKGTNTAVQQLSTVDLSFSSYRLRQHIKPADDLSLLIFDGEIDVQPGQFIFVWIPGEGEKPFSVLDDRPFTLSIQRQGCFSETLCQLEVGATVYVRGPYGVAAVPSARRKTLLVCGGSGLAALYLIAKRHPSSTSIFMGARDSRHLFYLEEARNVADVHIATEDGSLGCQGLVTELLEKHLAQYAGNDPLLFYNCGPEKMLEVALEIEQRYAAREHIYNSIDYVTKCGVGICGSCAAPNGERLCVDGPFL
ncbi:dihydroorotate dehydrogenase [candidate division KSB3 bacterium]|uniref:Dihydroorotate dehydrogenase n=1 Tax=candidate division KSB3 bacterium TaxID=2044937 RepID=A0A2G6E0L6_9BACT|nr:MAG: dihydroorotate dehydrogenase [candidate division KSB3 bacterium]PIE28332.1 MAG: dihydroorotate dehydrogenase [candidate division KSB3 bacterium]